MRALAIGLVAVLALVGCSADGGPSSASFGDQGSSAETDRLAFAGGADGTPLRLAMVRPDTFRPDEVALSDQGAVVIADLLYDGLTEIDGSGPRASLETGLATSWTADQDYRRWTFDLESASGVTADTVVASLAPLVVGGDDGAPPARAGVALTAGMRSVTAVDAMTVEIVLERSNAGLPWLLSGPPFSVVDVDGSPTGDYEIVGDGPASLHLQRRTERGGTAGPYPRIDVLWSDDATAAYRALVDGAADAAIVGPESLGEAEQRFGGGVVATSAVRFYVLNPGSAELADSNQRASLLATVDAAELVDDAGPAALVPIDGLVAPSMAGYRPAGCQDGCGATGSGAGEPSEPSAAWPPDVALRVTYAGDGQALVAESLAAQLARGGVAASATQATARQLATAIIEGSPDLFAFGWVAPAGSIDAVVPPLLRADSPANVARFASEEVEGLLNEAASTGDDGTRWSLLERAHRLALAESKVLPVAASTGTLVLSPDLSGVTIRADGSIDLERFG